MLASIRAQLGFYKRLYRHPEGRKLLFYHLKQISFKKPKKVRIVLCCNGAVIHGGLVDRLKGAISMYHVALELGAEFCISFTDPFQLSNYLEPNEVAWDKGDIRFNPIHDRILYKIQGFKPVVVDPMDWFDKKTPRTYFVYSNSDYLGVAYPHWPHSELRNLWKTYFFRLFSYSNVLVKGMSVLPQERRIVCHTRFMGILGDFNDLQEKRLSEEERIDLFALLDDRLKQISDRHPGVPLYLLSDSPLFLKHVEEVGVCKILPGTPKHVDIKNKETSSEEHLKTFTDFVFMAESDFIYSLVMPPMYTSMFCAMAAMLGGKKVLRIST